MKFRAVGDDPRTTLPAEELAAMRFASYPKVARSGSDAAMTMLGAALAVGLGVFTFVQMSTARLQPVEPSPTPAPVVVAEAPAPAPVFEPAPLPARPRPAIVDFAETEEGPRVRPDRLRAPALVVDESAPREEAAAAPLAGGVEGLTASEAFAMRAADSGMAPATATRIEDLSRVVLEGALIGGVLETALNSDLPGYVRAIVSEDVRSFDGTNVLIPRGSRIIGHYRSGLAIGESRAFVIWTRLVLPDGASIQLASPATDTLGRAGLGGKVDRHFVQRFGSAILLSIIGAGLDAAVDQNDNQIVIGSTSEAYSIAQTALAGSINIPPTIRVKQGAPIRIFVARDLYFPAQTLLREPGALR